MSGAMGGGTRPGRAPLIPATDTPVAGDVRKIASALEERDETIDLQREAISHLLRQGITQKRKATLVWTIAMTALTVANVAWLVTGVLARTGQSTGKTSESPSP